MTSNLVCRFTLAYIHQVQFQAQECFQCTEIGPAYIQDVKEVINSLLD